MDGGRIVEDCGKDDFFGNAAGRTKRSRHFLQRFFVTNIYIEPICRTFSFSIRARRATPV
jgi:hypothetical protein